MKIVLLAMLSLLPACDWFSKSEKKSSLVIKQERVLESFDELKVAGNFNVTLIKSDHEKVMIKTYENVMESVATQVEGGELNIYLSDATIQVPEPIAVHVYYKNINEIDITGAVMMKADNLRAPQLDISASGASGVTAVIDTDRLEIEGYGSSKFNFSGTAKKQKMDLSGAVLYNAGDLKSGEANVIAAGSAQIMLHVTKKILGELSGAVSVSYKGSAKVDVKSTGNSSITKVD